MKVNGIVVSSIDYKEASKIVYLYTPFGHKSIKALEGKKQQKGLLPFITTGNVVEAVITDAEFPTLVEYYLEMNMLAKDVNLSQMDALQVFLEVLRKIPDDANHAKIYPFAVDVINSIRDGNPLKALSIFLIKTTYVFGVAPSLKECSKCHQNEPVFLDLKDGVSYCSNCHSVKANNYKYFLEYYYSKKKIDEYSDCDFDDLIKDIFYYYQVHTGFTLKFMFRR